MRPNRLARDAKAELHVFEAMPHGGFGYATPEDGERIEENAQFIWEHICWN